jgi:hypothetical protein
MRRTYAIVNFLLAEHGFRRANVGQQVTTVSVSVPPTSFEEWHAVVYPTGHIPGE